MEPDDEARRPGPMEPAIESTTNPEEDEPEAELDLLSIGLAVFFVSLMTIVAALMLLPAIL